MKFIFESHYEGLLILPLVALALGECGNPNCQVEHLMFSAGWLCWTVGIVFEIGGCE